MQRAADEIGRRLMTGVEQEDALMQQLALGKRLGPVLTDDEARQYIGVRVAQVRAALVDERLQIRQHVGDRAVAPGRALHCQHRLERAQNVQRPAAQGPALVVRNAQQIADDADRNRRGEVVDQIDVAFVAHGREQAVDQLDETRLHGGDMPLADRADDRAPDACVQWRVVEDQARGVVL